MLNLSREEFWQLTWGEYHAKCYGLTYREEVAWLHTRYMVAMNLNLHVPKGKKAIKPEDLIRLSLFDKKVEKVTPVIRQWTQQEINEIKRRHGIIK